MAKILMNHIWLRLANSPSSTGTTLHGTSSPARGRTSTSIKCPTHHTVAIGRPGLVLHCLSAGVLRTDTTGQSTPPPTTGRREKGGNGISPLPGGGGGGGSGGGGVGGGMFAMNVIPGTPLVGGFDDRGGAADEGELAGLVWMRRNSESTKRVSLMPFSHRASGTSAYSTATATSSSRASGRSMGWWDRISINATWRASASASSRHSHTSSVPVYGRIDSPPPAVPSHTSHSLSLSSTDHHRQV